MTLHRQRVWGGGHVQPMLSLLPAISLPLLAFSPCCVCPVLPQLLGLALGELPHLFCFGWNLLRQGPAAEQLRQVVAALGRNAFWELDIQN
mmetsp:Transcript_84414/g.261166  ORF Transcript_84414/g.261166 Transcript_84414/m.261166 type:complete len:91 (-) Transcript_84414:1115-1387(-)